MVVAPIPSSCSATSTIFGNDPRDISRLHLSQASDRSDVQRRSEQYAFTLLTNFPLPQEVVSAFLNPIASERTEPSLLRVSETIGELLNPISIQGSMSPMRLEHHQQLVRGLARCLAWLYDRAPWDQNPVVEQSALQALIPLYWIPVDESWEQQLNQSLHFLRRHASFLLWRDSLEGVDIHSWLHRLYGSDRTLSERVEGAFRLSMSHLSYTFWSEMAARYQRSRPSDSSNISPKLEQDSWTLSASLLLNSATIQYPASLTSASRPIEDIREHWIRLRQSLSTWNSKGPAAIGAEPPEAASVASLLAQRFIPIADRKSALLLASLKQTLESNQDEPLLSLAVIRSVPSAPGSGANTYLGWVAELCNDEALTVNGMFKIDEQDWIIIYPGVDRSELARKIREVFEKLASPRSGDDRSRCDTSFVAGVASVMDPTSSFPVSGLVDGAWRCLEAAQLQGPNAVKTIQVY